MELIFSLDEISIAAKKFISLTDAYKIFAFHGNLGAGKTTFIKNICLELGVKGNISSPTFSIINEYISQKRNVIYHIDLYRIINVQEAVQAGVEDCFYSGNLCFIEWPEKVYSILPLDVVQVFIETIDINKRRLILKLP